MEINTAPHGVGIETGGERLAVLTDRQRQVVTLVCDGLSNKIIARKLGVCEGTVKIHLHAIYGKLDVRSRADLIVRFGTSRQVTG